MAESEGMKVELVHADEPNTLSDEGKTVLPEQEAEAKVYADGLADELHGEAAAQSLAAQLGEAGKRNVALQQSNASLRGALHESQARLGDAHQLLAAVLSALLPLTFDKALTITNDDLANADPTAVRVKTGLVDTSLVFTYEPEADE